MPRPFGLLDEIDNLDQKWCRVLFTRVATMSACEGCFCLLFGGQNNMLSLNVSMMASLTKCPDSVSVGHFTRETQKAVALCRSPWKLLALPRKVAARAAARFALAREREGQFRAPPQRGSGGGSIGFSWAAQGSQTGPGVLFCFTICSDSAQHQVPKIVDFKQNLAFIMMATDLTLRTEKFPFLKALSLFTLSQDQSFAVRMLTLMLIEIWRSYNCGLS